MRTVTVRPTRSGKVFDVVVLDDVASLQWAAQIGAIEIHPYLGTVDALDRPTSAVFDLDPGAGLGLLDAARAAQLVHDVLDGLGLDSYVKTSGQKGVHVVVPLDGTQTYDDVKPFVRAVAALLVRERPDELTDTMARTARAGKVLIDWSQNDAGKSTVAPYSLRGLRVPLASTPVAWDELDAAIRSGRVRDLVFTGDEVRARIDDLGDLFEPTLETNQRLP